MGERFRGRLTFANITSALALFVAVSTGGVYASQQGRDSSATTLEDRAAKLERGHTLKGRFQLRSVPGNSRHDDRWASDQWEQRDATTYTTEDSLYVDFGPGLRSTPKVVYAYSEIPRKNPASCRGTWKKPKAKPGVLCIYIHEDNNADMATERTPFGVTLHGIKDPDSQTHPWHVSGSFAVTAN